MKPKMQRESPTLSNLWFLRFDQNTIYRNILVLRWFWKLNFVCVWIPNMSAISGKTGNLNVSLKLFIFFRHHWFAKVLKTPEKFYLSHLSQRLDLQIARLLTIFLQLVKKLSLYKKWIFQLRISLVNVIKSASNCGFGHIYGRNPEWKSLFFVQYLHNNMVEYNKIMKSNQMTSDICVTICAVKKFHSCVLWNSLL